MGESNHNNKVSVLVKIISFLILFDFILSYGTRSTTEQCPQAIMTMCLQSMVGVLLSACMTGIVFAKLARPKVKHTTTGVLFANEKLQQK